MIRVTKTEQRTRTFVTIDGQLSGESVDVVETCCSQAEAGGKPVHLFLRDVTTVDQAGITLLRRLAGKGVHLLAKGLYTSYLVRTLGAGDKPAKRSPPDKEHPSISGDIFTASPEGRRAIVAGAHTSLSRVTEEALAK